MTDPLNNIFDDVGIWLLGKRIEFSCVYIYIPQGHHKYFISTLCLWSTYKYINVWYFSKSPSIKVIRFIQTHCKKAKLFQKPYYI